MVSAGALLIFISPAFSQTVTAPSVNIPKILHAPRLEDFDGMTPKGDAQQMRRVALAPMPGQHEHHADPCEAAIGQDEGRGDQRAVIERDAPAVAEREHQPPIRFVLVPVGGHGQRQAAGDVLLAQQIGRAHV